VSEQLYPRRTVLKGALTSLAAIPVVAFVGRAEAAAKVDPAGAQAKALGYVVDAGKVDAAANPTFKAGSHCANCVQWQGKPTDAEAGCGIFAGGIVPANGWCKVYAEKP